MADSGKIVFTINGQEHQLGCGYGPDVSLNEYIRNVADLKGTKYMCQEGGCGACIVAATAPHPATKELQTFSVNSCLVSVLSCHGWAIVTVEGIGNRTMGYHEVQTRLATFNGTQCGYCTPGWVMQMYSIYKGNGKKLSMKDIENSFASNMCRCTGYRPILDAFKSLATNPDQALKDRLADLEDLGGMFKTCGVKCLSKCKHEPEKCSVILGKKFDFCYNKESKISESSDCEINDKDWSFIDSINDNKILIDCDGHRWVKAYTLGDVYSVTKSTSDYKLIAGNTGQGVYHVTDYPTTVVDISSVEELRGHIVDVNLIINSGMTLSETMILFKDLALKDADFGYLQEFYDHLDLVAHLPVRNIGTIGGNLFMKHQHNDFQSDVFLLFETVGAIITLGVDTDKKMEMDMMDFLRTDMSGKLILNVKLPPLGKFYLLKTYKIMPRSQNAHALVNSGFLFKMKENTNIIENARIVYGSIAPKFVHAEQTEQVLKGKTLFTNETLSLALKSLRDELKAEEAPAEPSAAYRNMLGVALFYKAVLSLCPDNMMSARMKSGGDAMKRVLSRGVQTFETDKNLWPLNQPIPKIEALVQCSGEATFANDLPTMKNEVFAAFVLSTVGNGTILEFDNSDAMKIEGVVAFYTHRDIPGKNTYTPTNVPLQVADEEILCSGDVKYYGQPVAIVVAKREKTANKAASLVKVKYSAAKNKPVLNVLEAFKAPDRKNRITKTASIEPKEKGKDVHTIIYGKYYVNGQYHYHMEPQTCVTVPTEDGMDVYSSTQWLDLTNIAVAQCINVPENSVNVIVRRLGGAYGAKITRASSVACSAALVSKLLGVPCRMVLPIETNMASVGKRLPNYNEFEVAVNRDGEIQYLINKFYHDNGCSNNETISPLVIEHFYNCYDPKRWQIEANSVVTDTASNTWCRAPASTEGVAMSENIMEQIAHELKKDPVQIRILNMKKDDNPIPDMIERIKIDSEFDKRSMEIQTFNTKNRWRKRAIKLLPMKYDLNFFGNFTSIVSIYHGDGSVNVTHGGIEMGQGLNTKVAQVCAHFLGVPLSKVSVKPSSSYVIPNAMVTGGSIGSETVSLATVKACEKLNARLEPFRKKLKNPSWEKLVTEAFNNGVELQASHMFTIADDVKNYEIFGVTVIEVEVDILTGNHEVKRVDILEDVGQSLSPTIDIGQIEGAFVMGLGYWTSEKLAYDRSGKLLTDRTWTYKPPGAKDIPMDMRVYFKRGSRNPNGVLNSKASGEPPLCMAVSVTFALREAVRAARLEAGESPDLWIEIENPCTAENIFLACNHKIENFKLI